MRLARAAFLRCLALVYLVAFVSLALQVRGLLGRNGILPAERYLAAAGQALGPSPLDRLARVPTLFWVSASDAALLAACAAGGAAAIVVLADLLPLPALALCWLSYLSLVAVGQVFLSFQWDVLLLEVGFLALFASSLRGLPRRPADDGEPPLPVVWLFRWLLFRLMFGSGVVKLASGDPTWRDLTALDHHFETQPLPTVAGWWAHQLSPELHAALTAGMFAIELVLPLLVFTSRRLRALAALGFVALQLGIGLTGNYTFFNFLSVALCLWLVDDELWPRRWRERWLEARADRVAPAPSRAWPLAVTLPLAALVAMLSVAPVAGLFGRPVELPGPLATAIDALTPLRLVNRYGLFAVMTTERPELRIEVSRDGLEWRELPFRWKPDDPLRAPRWVQPHQPRLDWQMWFAALGGPRSNPWVQRLLQRVRAGDPAVMALFAASPLTEGPPRFVRATLWDYRMTSPAERRATGAWWRAQPLGPWGPVVGPLE